MAGLQTGAFRFWGSMRVLVTFAVEAEFAPWRALRQFVKKRSGTAEFYSAQIGGAEVNVLLTGVGGKSAWLETTRIVWDGDVDICVSSGLAGALHLEYQPGDILAAKEVQAVDSKRVVVSDANLVQLAIAYGARAVASFYSVNHVIGLAVDKCELGRVADAVEMESGEVLYEASAFGARVIAIRGISDAVDEDLPLDFNKVVTPAGEVSIPRVLGQVVRHPMSAPSLVRFGKQSRVAAERLGAFLDRYVEGVISSMSTSIGVTVT